MNKFTDSADQLAIQIGNNNGEIALITLMVFGIYVFLRMKKKNLIWVADIFMTFLMLAILLIVFAPHRYYALSYFIMGVFR